MPIDALGRFLVRVPGGPLDATHVGLLPGTTMPLFPDQGQGVGPPEVIRSIRWVLHTPAQITEEHPWDAAHAIVAMARNVLQTQATANLYVEPDLIHRRYAQMTSTGPESEAATTPPWLAVAGPDSHYPPDPDEPFSVAWHLDRGNFPRAWNSSKGENVRIAHLDTGYYPAHVSTPRHILPHEGYNYYDGNPNVADPGTELNAGHGTATLALVAGGYMDLIYTSPKGTQHTYSGDIGGAPEAYVVPVRIGGVLGSVVHLYSSSMAQGLHHAQGITAPVACAACDVVTLSHGGVPSQAWVDEVNNLYDKGIVLAAASGDSIYLKIIDLATHYTVYPSAWWRVITVTGETFSHGPYTTQDIAVMQGCWGPTPLMKKSLGGFTPNVPWMRLKIPTAWGMDGSGTSASTPQVAAACALWISQNLASLPRDWRRVEATRYMLLSHLNDPELNFEKIGRGAVNAAGLFADPSLSAAIIADANRAHPQRLVRRDPDECSWPLFRLLFGLPPPGNGFDEMAETEALQLAYRSTDPRLQDAMATYRNGIGIPRRLAHLLRERFVLEPDMSRTLRNYLKPRV